jgi:phosphatidyl-myo-inositol dimannoside synthase
MKVGFVAPEFPPDTGGVQTYAWHTARELVQFGHDVTVFTQPHPGGEARADGLRIEPLLKLRRRHDRAIAQRDVDVWHVMNATCAWLALDTAVPVFVTVHGNDFLASYHPFARLDLPFSDRFDRWLGDMLTRRLMRRALPHARHIFTNSRHTERIFLQHHPACGGKTSVASVGLTEEDFAPHATLRASGPPRFITISRLAERRKNVPAVLEALAHLRPVHDFHYTIVGDGTLRPEFEHLTAKLGLGDRVTFTGLVSRECKIELLRESDLFILPAVATAHSYEGFGIVYLEANACGTPTLAARLGGAVEAVEEGVSGFFVETPDAGGIAAAISRFLRREIAFAPEACEAFARRFSWRAVAKHCAAHFAAALPLR